MGILDNESQNQKIDKEGMLQSIKDLPDQVAGAWDQIKNFAIPTPYIKAKNVLILAMGGSAIGGDLIKDLALANCKVPIQTMRNYDIPDYVNNDTLVIAVSYSGNTEETLTAFSQAAKKGAKLLAISTGGKISAICRKYKAPLFKIEYGAMPRAALGYTMIPILGIFDKLGFINLGRDEVDEAMEILKLYQQKIDPGVPTGQNLAKQLAERLSGKIPIVIASDLLNEVARRYKTQLNENSKSMAIFECLPELCHNTISGLNWPEKLRDKVFFIILQSKFDHQRNRLRQQILMQILHKKGLSYEMIFVNPQGGKLAEMLTNITFADYVSYYLAMLYKEDPTANTMIDFLKDKLSEKPIEED